MFNVVPEPPLLSRRGWCLRLSFALALVMWFALTITSSTVSAQTKSRLSNWAQDPTEVPISVQDMASEVSPALYRPSQQLMSIQNRLGKEFDRPLRLASYPQESMSFNEQSLCSDPPADSNLPTVDIPPNLDTESISKSMDESSDYRSSKGLFSDLMKQSLDLPYKVRDDYANFYFAPESWVRLGVGFSFGAIIANTSVDQEMYNEYQAWRISTPGLRSTRDLVHRTKVFGEGHLMLPIYLGVWGASTLIDSPRFGDPVGEWGLNTTRGLLVGVPAMLFLQWATGASRPEEPYGSDWRFFQDTNGVSGHSFVGALPFITAAKMTDRMALKALFYAGSTLTPLSRVNDEDHYPSQSILGWWVAFMAASAVDVTDNPDRRWHVYPFGSPSESGIAAEYRW